MEMFTPLFQAVIAFVAVLTGLGFVFNLLLGPVKANQARLEKGLEKFKAEVNTNLEKIKIEVNTKLDKLLSK